MSNNVSRREILSSASGLFLGGTPAITFGKLAQTSIARTNRNINAYGVVLTGASLTELRDCVKRGRYNTIKVVTAWGLNEYT